MRFCGGGRVGKESVCVRGEKYKGGERNWRWMMELLSGRIRAELNEYELFNALRDDELLVSIWSVCHVVLSFMLELLLLESDG